MKDKFKKYELKSFVFFLISCTTVFAAGLLNSWYFGMLFRGLYLIGGVAIIVFTIKAVATLNKSKVKKVLLVIAQLIGYFVLYVIWLILCIFFSGGINFY
ncbi:MAG: hypothetical protein IJ035_01265 [Oscillospiraceae bacterium]|nr:hypothetical protein [Oscillospiraceae bacterium]